MVVSFDGKCLICDQVSGVVSDVEVIGIVFVNIFKGQGVGEIFKEIFDIVCLEV